MKEHKSSLKVQKKNRGSQNKTPGLDQLLY